MPTPSPPFGYWIRTAKNTWDLYNKYISVRQKTTRPHGIYTQSSIPPSAAFGCRVAVEMRPSSTSNTLVEEGSSERPGIGLSPPSSAAPRKQMKIKFLNPMY
eukprot:Filipodium_phascolosomae@DN2533_c0_g1_i1.p2